MATPANSTPTSKIDRRTAIRGLAVGAAVGFVAFDSDPILDAIQAYKDGLADYNANAPWHDDDLVDAYAEQTYGPSMRALAAWDEHARSREGLIAALELAQNEMSQFGENPLTSSMIEAALGFLNT